MFSWNVSSLQKILELSEEDVIFFLHYLTQEE